MNSSIYVKKKRKKKPFMLQASGREKDPKRSGSLWTNGCTKEFSRTLGAGEKNLKFSDLY
jgi:hypothetical protein